MSAANGDGKHYLTSGDLARLLGVAPKKACELLDEGTIPGGRRLPGSDARRVHRDDLADWLATRGMTREYRELTGEPLAPPPVLLVGCPAVLAEALGLVLRESVACAGDLFAAGLAVAEGRPRAVVLDAGQTGRAEATAAARALAGREAPPAVVALVPEDWPRSYWLAQGQGGVRHVLQHPVDPATLAALLPAAREGG